MQEFFGEYVNVITGLSTGTVALLLWRIVVFFKKDKYLLPFINIAQKKSTELFGSANVESFIKIVKDIKVEDIPVAIKEVVNKVDSLEALLKILLTNQLTLGVYDDNPEMKATLEKLL